MNLSIRDSTILINRRPNRCKRVKDIRLQEKGILLSTTSICLGSKIKDLATAEDMWKVVKNDATSKSTLCILDAEDQLSSMKLVDNDNSKTHLVELKNHFQTMLQRRDNLMKIGSTMSDTRFNTIIMSSLPESYRPALQ